MRLKRETQGAFCVLNANAKSQTRKSMKINVICTVDCHPCDGIFLNSRGIRNSRRFPGNKKSEQISENVVETGIHVAYI